MIGIDLHQPHYFISPGTLLNTGHLTDSRRPFPLANHSSGLALLSLNMFIIFSFTFSAPLWLITGTDAYRSFVVKFKTFGTALEGHSLSEWSSNLVYFHYINCQQFERYFTRGTVSCRFHDYICLPKPLSADSCKPSGLNYFSMASRKFPSPSTKRLSALLGKLSALLPGDFNSNIKSPFWERLIKLMFYPRCISSGLDLTFLRISVSYLCHITFPGNDD